MLLREKENDMLRLVIDARRANRRFADAPGVALATPEALARLEVADGVTPYMAEVDVDNCFYRLRIDHDLGRFFCLPPIRASEAGVYMARGKVVDGSDLVWHHLSVLPMGIHMVVIHRTRD